MAESKDFSESTFGNKGPTSQETIKLAENLTIPQWESFIQACESREVDKGTNPKFCFEVRRKQGQPVYNTEIIYWGRDGWDNGFTHAEIFAERLTDTYLAVYAQKSDDDEAMSLTRLSKKVDGIIQDAIENVSEKDKL